MDQTTQTVFLIFTIAIAVSVLIQTIAIIAMGLAARKMQKKVHTMVEEFRTHALPAISSSRAMMDDFAPKFKIISANLVESSNKLKTMAGEVGNVVGDVSERTRTQAAHFDGMVQGTLDHITQASSSIQHGVAVPVRQITGILNGFRAAMNVMCQKSPRRDSEVESDLFI